MNRWTVSLASIDRIWPLADCQTHNHKWNEHCCEIVFNLKTTNARRIHQSSMATNCRWFRIETLNIPANSFFIHHNNSHIQTMNLRSFPLNFNQQLFLQKWPKSKKCRRSSYGHYSNAEISLKVISVAQLWVFSAPYTEPELHHSF